MIGNCLTAAVYGMLKLRTTKLRCTRARRRRHYYVIDRKGGKWHMVFRGRIKWLPHWVFPYLFKGALVQMDEHTLEFFQLK